MRGVLGISSGIDSWSGSTGPIAGRGGPKSDPRGGSHDIHPSSAKGTFGGAVEEARIPSADRGDPKIYPRSGSHDLHVGSSKAASSTKDTYAKGAFGGVPSSSSCPWLCYEKNLYITHTYSSSAPDVAGRFEYIRAGFW